MTSNQNLENYIHEVLDQKIKMKPWKEEVRLPIFFRDLYKFYTIELFKKQCIVVLARKDGTITPAVIGKHLKLLQTKHPAQYIYMQTATSSYNRNRLIQHGISFVIPGNQMYLPNLGIDLREHFRTAQKPKQNLSPAAQLVLIYLLNHTKQKQFSALELSRELKYTVMTMSRVVRELVTHGFAKVQKEGRLRWLCLTHDRRKLWEDTKPLLCSPLKKCVWIQTTTKLMDVILKSGVIAGATALSRLSMLNPPLHPVYAIDLETWKLLLRSNTVKEKQVSQLPTAENLDLALEIWSYDPKLFAKNGIADQFSLYLSLQENEDERVKIALETVMEKIKW